MSCNLKGRVVETGGGGERRAGPFAPRDAGGARRPDAARLRAQDCVVAAVSAGLAAAGRTRRRAPERRGAGRRRAQLPAARRASRAASVLSARASASLGSGPSPPLLLPPSQPGRTAWPGRRVGGGFSRAAASGSPGRLRSPAPKLVPPQPACGRPLGAARSPREPVPLDSAGRLGQDTSRASSKDSVRARRLPRDGEGAGGWHPGAGRGRDVTGRQVAGLLGSPATAGDGTLLSSSRGGDRPGPAV